MPRLLIVSSPIDGDAASVLKVLNIVGIDRKTYVVVVGSEALDSDICGRYLCLELSPNLDEISRSIFSIIHSRGISCTRLVLGDTSPLTAAALYTLYLLLSTVEPYLGIEVRPLGIVYRDELMELDFKPRLNLDLKALRILAKLDGCRTCGELSMELGIPQASARRRLTNMARSGILYMVHRGRRHAYCPTALARMFSHYPVHTPL